MRRSLSSNVIANAMTAAALLGTALLAVPLILDGVGTTGYGVWTLALTIILYVTTAEAGLGPAIQRFVAVDRGTADDEGARRLLWTSLALYGALGLVVAVAMQPLAPAIVALFDVPADLNEDAESMFRLLGPVLAAALLVAALGNVQQGLERFVAFAISAGVGSLAYLVAIAVLMRSDAGLSGLAEAALLQQGVMFLTRAVDLGRTLGVRRPRLASKGRTGEVLRFSIRLQVTVLAHLVNAQTDRVVVGLVAPLSTLGQLGIGAQVADAGRLLSGAALAPMVSRMSQTYGEGREQALAALFARLHRLWLIGVIGGTVIGAATIHPLIEAWLGGDRGTAALLGGILIAGYGLNLLTGTGVAYLRAVGRPSLEGRYGIVLIVANLVFVIALGVTLGAVGAVCGTLIAYALGGAWFFRRLRPEIGAISVLSRPEAARLLLLAALAGALALGWGLAMVALLPTGVSLLPVAAGAGLAFVAYVSAATGVRPTPQRLLALTR